MSGIELSVIELNPNESYKQICLSSRINSNVIHRSIKCLLFL